MGANSWSCGEPHENRLFYCQESCARVAGLARSVSINHDLLGDYVASLPVEIALNPVMDTENHFAMTRKQRWSIFSCSTV